jgi:hypothetical protein
VEAKGCATRVTDDESRNIDVFLSNFQAAQPATFEDVCPVGGCRLPFFFAILPKYFPDFPKHFQLPFQAMNL